MSSGSIVPVFDPQGTLRDVPFEHLRDAINAGGKPGIRMQAPDGKVRYVPPDLMQDAVKAGGKMLPVQDQSVPHEGFWSALGSDLKGMGEGLVHSITDTDSPSIWSLEGAKQGFRQDVSNYQRERAAGHGRLYSGAATAASDLGVNVPGMEQAATEGNPGAVLGHAAAVPAAMAGTYGIGEAAPVIKAAAPQVLEHTPVVGPSIRLARNLNRVITAAADGTEAPKGPPTTADLQAWWKQRGGVLKSERPNGPIHGSRPVQAAEAPTPTEPQGIAQNAAPEPPQQAETEPQTPAWAKWPPEAPKVAFQDVRDDAAIQDAMQNDLNRHEMIGRKEAQRQFIAGNTTGETKGSLSQAFTQKLDKERLTQQLADIWQQIKESQPPYQGDLTNNPTPEELAQPPRRSRSRPNPADNEDLTDLLKQSVARARAAKAQNRPPGP